MIKRYEFWDDDGGTNESPDGEWVRHEDHQQVLKTEIARAVRAITGVMVIDSAPSAQNPEVLDIEAEHLDYDQAYGYYIKASEAALLTKELMMAIGTMHLSKNPAEFCKASEMYEAICKKVGAWEGLR